MHLPGDISAVEKADSSVDTETTKEMDLSPASADKLRTHNSFFNYSKIKL